MAFKLSAAVPLLLAQPYSCLEIFIELWAGPTVEVSARETAVYRSIEKAFFDGDIPIP